MKEGDESAGPTRYNVDGLVHDAVSLKITSFMLDCYRHEYEDMVVSEINGPQVSFSPGHKAGSKQACHTNGRAAK